MPLLIVMSNYALFRRDRNWNGTDMSRNGGIAIYNLRSKFLEDIIRKYSHFNDFDDTVDSRKLEHSLTRFLYNFTLDNSNSR